MAGNFPQNGDAPPGVGGQEVPPQLVPIIKWGVVVLALVLLFALLSFARSVYTDWLWYGSLGFRSVFVKILTTRIVMFLVGALAFGALLGPSLYFAHRLSRGPVTLPLPPEVVDLFRKLISWGSVATLVILSVIFGALFASRWEVFLRFANSVLLWAGRSVFDKDVSFYVFTLPMLNFVRRGCWALPS